MSDEVMAEERPRRMLSIDKVLEIVPVGRTTLYRMEQAKKFPPSTWISAGRRVWYEDEVIAWQKELGRRRGRRPR